MSQALENIQSNRVTRNSSYPEIRESNNLYERAEGLIPAFTQTLAKGPTQHVEGVAPKYLQMGKGARVWDVDGNEYLDFTMGVGPLVLGYTYPRVDNAIRKQLENGITFSLMHPLEVEAAELIRQVVPNAEAVRYSKTGADVTSAAVRLSRAFTGREKVVCCGYHGWHDWYIGTSPRRKGVPGGSIDLVKSIPYNNLDTVKAALSDDVACVILEPMIFEFPRDGFLAELQTLCRANGSLLIFDEMWTGFRLALGGAQEYFEVKPDLACYSKAIANGMPISVLTGRQEVMRLLDEEVFFFTTFGGEALSLAATMATIREIRDQNVPEHLARIGAEIQNGYRAIAREAGLEGLTDCIGHPARTLVTFSPEAGDPLLIKSFVQQELIRFGVLWSGFHNISFSHTAWDVQHTLGAYREILPKLKETLDAGKLESRLRGRPVQPVFRKTTD
ncbi:MAG TPA: aminotransferase class III-fold pyridoxal phosphate-dependent enzyme [Calditrichia bacterium]|nr:aminotransferase class III-fold pyridoxal phosphate-dependent enzyme [Calditrichota bacterium]HQU72046.1 aminotransferase class III-fold pyridoxal phosphate-dependent enzyme [Calditrichia bacterium]HQV33250.1 aminotransferase class III-fold pyridoxal phosphate-dependent enzyme [Calditrichia bacterium]